MVSRDAPDERRGSSHNKPQKIGNVGVKIPVVAAYKSVQGLLTVRVRLVLVLELCSWFALVPHSGVVLGLVLVLELCSWFALVPHSGVVLGLVLMLELCSWFALVPHSGVVLGLELVPASAAAQGSARHP